MACEKQKDKHEFWQNTFGPARSLECPRLSTAGRMVEKIAGSHTINCAPRNQMPIQCRSLAKRITAPRNYLSH
jgi:hypothetical protein